LNHDLACQVTPESALGLSRTCLIGIVAKAMPHLDALDAT